MAERHYNDIDRLLIGLDQALRTVFGKPDVTERRDPAAGADEPELTPEQARRSSALMRVDHAGEVCAQALYQGQALTAKLPNVRASMERAAAEENDHLHWCANRLNDLGSHTSYLNPVWYLGSFTIGALAGVAGDKWSLGFVAETERQVVRHLEQHLTRLPAEDVKSRAVLEQMRDDEYHHATTAVEAGGAPLPAPVRTLMSMTSKVMTSVAYWI